MGSTLKSIFGSEEVGDLVKNFNFDKNESGLAVSFAPLYGPLNKQTMKELSPENQIFIAAVTKTMSKVAKDDRNYESVLSSLMQNPFVQPENDKSIVRSNTFHTENNEFAKFDGSPDADIVNKIRAWFSQLVQDEEVVRTVGFGAEAVAKVVAQSGATVTDLESAIHKEEKHSKVFDITFLNFPDVAEPYFKLQHVQLEAWSKSDRTGLFQTDSNGITGDYRVRAFTYNNNIMSSLSETARSKAVQYAAELFD